jgi:hypothetical protein
MKSYATTCFVTLFLSISYLYSQTGGSHTYDFLNLTNSARVASLGGKNISLNDNDLNLSYHNPSLLNNEQNGNLVMNYVSYFSSINYGYASYATKGPKNGSLAIGLHYVDYGQFDAADKLGNLTGSKFYGADYALNIIYSHAIDSSFRWGVNLKPLYSSLEHYNSFGIASDFGITYTADQGLLSSAFVIKNLGFQISSYTGNDRESIPFELQLGVSKKFQFAPFRISFTAHNLQKYNMLYDKESNAATENMGITNNQSESSKFADNLFRHIVIGIEFIPTKSFYVAISYDHKKRKEMALEEYGNNVGFSYGFGLKLKKFSLAYGYSVLHAAGGSNHFSFMLNISKLYHK